MNKFFCEPYPKKMDTKLRSIYDETWRPQWKQNEGNIVSNLNLKQLAIEDVERPMVEIERELDLSNGCQPSGGQTFKEKMEMKYFQKR